jgi:molybdenum cofactor cytidylyltransferase
MIAAIVLAAGSSTRFGSDKRLHPIGGMPMARLAVIAALAAGLEPVIVVSRPNDTALAAALAGTGAWLVANADPSRGSRSSLRAGLAAVPAASSGAVVLLADMPLVLPGMVAAVASALGSAPLVLSRYGTVQAPPTGISRALFAELDGEGDDGGRTLVGQHRAEALVLDWPAEALLDVDNPGDAPS